MAKYFVKLIYATTDGWNPQWQTCWVVLLEVRTSSLPSICIASGRSRPGELAKVLEATLSLVGHA